MTLTTRSLNSLTGTLTGTAIGSSLATFQLDERVDATVADGTDAGENDIVYHAVLSLATGANTTLDLTGGTLEDPLGNALIFVDVTQVRVAATAANTTTLTIGAAASEPFLMGLGGTAPTMALLPGQVLDWSNRSTGWPVTVDTNDKLKITNGSGATATATITIIGRSA